MAVLIKQDLEMYHCFGDELSRHNNFAALRQTLYRPDNSLMQETEISGQSYVRMEAKRALGSGFIEFIQFEDDFITVISDMTFAHSAGFDYKGENWLRFKFKLDGAVSMLFDSDHKHDTHGQSAHILAHPEGMKHSDLYHQNSTNRWVSILCKRERLLDAMAINPEHLPTPLTRFLADNEEHFFFQDIVPSFKTIQTIKEMFEGPQTKLLRPLHLRVKSYEALLSLLDDMLGENPRIEGLQRRDIDKLYEARSLIQKDGMQHYNLNSLARAVGLNRNKLSAGFRDVFGVTIADFCLQQRLSDAKRLLHEGGLSVSEVAYEVGYNHVSNFSSAFRKYFDESPFSYRQKQNRR